MNKKIKVTSEELLNDLRNISEEKGRKCVVRIIPDDSFLNLGEKHSLEKFLIDNNYVYYLKGDMKEKDKTIDYQIDLNSVDFEYKY